jgi:hypothetical protein
MRFRFHNDRSLGVRGNLLNKGQRSDRLRTVMRTGDGKL